MSRSSDVNHDLSAAVKLINEQTDVIQELRSELNTEKDRNGSLVSKLDVLTNQIGTMISNYNNDIESKKKEIETLKETMEAQNELQASINDEIRFQMQSLRHKIDNSKKVENGPTSPNKSPLMNSPKLISLTEETKKVLRKNSDDSTGTTGSIPCLLSHSNTVHRGEIIWRVNAVSKKLKKIQSGSYEDPSRSEPFSTGPHGYRLSVWAYLNGRGKGAGKCLSLYIRVMAGEFDPVLFWPIKPCYTFYLISQNPDTHKRLDLVRVRDLSIKHNGIFRPKKDDKSVIVGFDDFIIHEDMEKKHFLFDDSLFLKCVVDIPQS